MLTEKRGLSPKISKEWRPGLESTVSEVASLAGRGGDLSEKQQKEKEDEECKAPLGLVGQEVTWKCFEPVQ